MTFLEGFLEKKNNVRSVHQRINVKDDEDQE